MIRFLKIRAVFIYLMLAFATGIVAELVDNQFQSHVLIFALQEQSHAWFALQEYDQPRDSALNVLIMSAYSPVHERNYPRESNLCIGLNDTLVLEFKFMNLSNSAFTWDKNPDLWFAPRLHEVRSSIMDDAPAVDSTALGYSIRRWSFREGASPVVPPDSFLAKQFEYSMFMNVWNIPAGQWVISANLTEYAPQDIHIVVSGMEFLYDVPTDGQDSVNAYIGCSQRLLLEKNFLSALTWVDSAIVKFPMSVPAWWEKGIVQLESGDTVKAMESLDSAIYYLEEKKDLLLPDTSLSIKPVERLWMRYTTTRLSEDRSNDYQE